MHSQQSVQSYIDMLLVLPSNCLAEVKTKVMPEKSKREEEKKNNQKTQQVPCNQEHWRKCVGRQIWKECS